MKPSIADVDRHFREGWLPVESIADTGGVATVYNFRVAEYHTSYVGSPHWGFAVWSHNSNCVRGAVVQGDDAPSRAADPSAVVNALSGFRSRRFVVDGVTILLDKSGMKHIMERHSRCIGMVVSKPPTLSFQRT